MVSHLKNTLRIVAFTLILGMALLIQGAMAFTTNGNGPIDLAQRSVRILDNFGSGAHSNQTTDSNFPGYTEVELAAFKAIAEWGSRPFGTDGGDGEACFDWAWNGQAPSSGAIGENCISKNGGLGVLALTWMNIPKDGDWKIQMGPVPGGTWSDDPTSPPSGDVDFQGVLVHELGHALGLGHTGHSGNTMKATIQGDGTANRDLGSDDQSGIQNIYGSITDCDPEITSISVAGGDWVPGATVTITGEDFDLYGDPIVWLNRGELTPAGGMNLLEVTPTSSTSTTVVFDIPDSNAESGGVYVVDDDPSGQKVDVCDMTNGWPILVGDENGFPVNSIRLKGDTSGNAGATVDFQFEGALASLPYKLFIADNLDGQEDTSLGYSHFLDISTTGMTKVDDGTADSNGEVTGTWTVPSGASSGTIYYLEVVVKDTAASPDQLYNSNWRKFTVN